MSSSIVHYAWLVPFLPLLGGIVAALFGRRLKGLAHVPVVAGIACAFLVSLSLLGAAKHASTTLVYDWLTIDGLNVPILLRVDGLTTMMLCMVTFVATLVAIYATGYMAGDPAYPRFFAVVGLFVFSMTGLVLSSHFVLTYSFWEGVGVCSYLLVGFWHNKPAAASAAKKAFLVNRIGDFGFAVALFWMWTLFKGDLSYDNVLDADKLSAISASTKMGLAMLLFWAATAKSAQIPLYVWLPDAMEGPTPVSALIHAATMVTAGVYLIARSSVLIWQVPQAQVIIAVIGCATALLAALIALTQTDLKRVMAYSTVSQLGYMFMGLGAGVGNVARFAVIAAMFHLFTHAFFKALLFLASGSVMHAMGGVIDMRRFGGLRHRLPYTCWTFAVGGLALAGIFPLAGFWSKDEILAALNMASHAGAGWEGIYAAVYWTAVFTAFLTAFYTGRAFFMTFFGVERLPGPSDPEADPAEAQVAAHGHGHDDSHGHGDGHDSHFGHESPPIMWVPLVILAACAILVGMVFGPTHLFEHHLAQTPGFHEEHAVHATGWLVPIVGTLAGVLGLALSWVMYGKPSPLPGRLAQQLRPLYLASLRKFQVDEVYDATIVRATRALASISAFLDRNLVDGLVQLTARIPRFVARNYFAPFQNGLIQYYAAASALVVACLLIILLLM